MQSNKLKTKVRRFWLQETKSFPEGAPQRESYFDDLSFERACVVYEKEWRQQYQCENQCKNVDCPQCGAQGSKG